MVRTRRKDYAEEAKTARGVVGDHVGKRRHGAFHIFQELPCELRLMVWEAAMTPRLVAVNPSPYPKDLDEARNRKNREISLIRGIPPLLAVNQEARHVALRHYTWRFTMDYMIVHRGWEPAESERRRAHVIMSPEDTLGLFRCRDNSMGAVDRIRDFDVKVANDKRSPWRVHQTTDAPREPHWFKKVAILGSAIKSNLHIVRALNITLWDLDSILNAPSAGVRMARSPHTKHKILVESAEEVDTAIPAYPTTGTPRRPVDFLDRDGQSLDVLAYKLADGEKGGHEFDGVLTLIARHSLP